jgi:hypothetical protein
LESRYDPEVLSYIGDYRKGYINLKAGNALDFSVPSGLHSFALGFTLVQNVLSTDYTFALVFFGAVLEGPDFGNTDTCTLDYQHEPSAK